MSNLRTIALIFVIGMAANFLHSLFFGIDEQIDSRPPDVPDVDVKNIQPEVVEPPSIYPDEETFETQDIEFKDEDEYFEEDDYPDPIQPQQRKF